MDYNNIPPKMASVIGVCLHAAANGPFFPDWEFDTLLGASRHTVSRIAAEWPNPTVEQSVVEDVVANVLINLVGYPHEKGRWSEFISVTPQEIREVYDTLFRRAGMK